MSRIAIFASGSGTNAENIIKYFSDKPAVTVVMVLSNKKDAKVLDRAKRLNVKTLVFDRAAFQESEALLRMLKKEVDYIILAGFLWKIPENFIRAFPNKIINIHPALLPKYGGKGMYGNHIHEAVVLNNEKVTGITIHFVNEHYDEGAIIFQKEVSLSKEDTPKSVAEKVHELEYQFFPKIIESVIVDG
ncbi:phosphoribosylglycinamide formyltransferase [Flavobacteriaceae bacterium F08102]|nr:phosphoribosylglycinamide formyltransferase [Flavobacteriaceae bacterium F08102]